jgi:hypothetical protein
MDQVLNHANYKLSRELRKGKDKAFVGFPFSSPYTSEIEKSLLSE